jgi:methyl-accepting chemotaxis protein
MQKNPDDGRRIKPILVNFFVYSKFGVQVVAVTLIFLALASYFIGEAFYQQYQQIVEIFQVVDSSIRHELVVNDIVIRNVVFLGLTILTYIGVMVYLIVRTQHRYEGPLVSIQRFVADIIRGDYGHRIVIRKGDEMQDLVQLLNEMAESLQQRHNPSSSKNPPKAQS